MSRHTPARVLAPLALVAVAVALFTLLSGGGPGGSDSAKDAARSSTSEAKPKAARKARRRPRARKTARSTYTIRPGDTPSGIAEKTDVPVEKLLELNPELDPQSLSPGVTLKLR